MHYFSCFVNYLLFYYPASPKFSSHRRGRPPQADRAAASIIKNSPAISNGKNTALRIFHLVDYVINRADQRPETVNLAQKNRPPALAA